ncbi:MAG: beta-galactosidase, partial [Acidobacteriaceae bacterium]|nr:beta-galactosidase [Acidobacteriaceae bacterium]
MVHPFYQIRLTCFLVLCTTTPTPAEAQQSWQHLSTPTANSIAELWNSPPPEYGPEPYYGLNGPVTDDIVRRDLDRMKALGFRAVTVQAGYNMPWPYLSADYFAFMKRFVAEAAKRDMRVWIVDDAGYPSGFAGGRFTTDRPDLRMQALVIAKRIPVSPGTPVHDAVPVETVAVTAVGEGIPNLAVPFANAEISWTPRAGVTELLVVEHAFRTSPTRSDTNPKRVKDTSQSLEDYLDPAATEQYLAFTHEQYRRKLGDEFRKTILGFRGDEPDYSIGGLPWTPKFFGIFEEKKGYDVRPYLAAILDEKTHPISGATLRVKADYFDVFSQLFRDGFFKPQGDWCAANHLEYQVHLNHEEQQLLLTRSEGDFFRDMRYVQVPGIDAIWHQIWTDTISDYPRLASSVAHVYGRPRAFTESFAAYRPEPDVNIARYILNEQLVRGINLVEMMHFPASSSGSREPSPYMGQPGFPELTHYVRRLSYTLAAGRPGADVALYLPTSALWMNHTEADTRFVSAERLLSERQIDFDIVSDDALARDLALDARGFTTLSGNTYRTVILPHTSALSEATYERLKMFAAYGRKVLFLDGVPQQLSGRTFLNSRTVAHADFGWAQIVSGAPLPATPTPPAYPPSAKPEPMLV